MKEFAEKLKELRIEKGLSPEELSKKLEESNMYIAPNSIRNYENGIFPKDTNTYNKLANFFEVTPNYLFDHTIENRSYENIDIAKTLNFSDKSIKKLKNVKTNGLNLLIENINIDTFSKNLTHFFTMNSILLNDMKTLSGLLVKKYYTTSSLDFLRYYIKKCDIAFNNIINYFENSDYFLVVNSNDLENFKNNYIDLKNLIINSTKMNYTLVKNTLTDFIYSYGNLDAVLLEISDMIEFHIVKEINWLLSRKRNETINDVCETDSIEEIMTQEYNKYIS